MDGSSNIQSLVRLQFSCLLRWHPIARKLKESHQCLLPATSDSDSLISLELWLWAWDVDCSTFNPFRKLLMILLQWTSSRLYLCSTIWGTGILEIISEVNGVKAGLLIAPKRRPVGLVWSCNNRPIGTSSSLLSTSLECLCPILEMFFSKASTTELLNVNSSLLALD